MPHYPQIQAHRITHLEIPVQFDRLRDIAYNMWWCWSGVAQRLFERLDSRSWELYRNPIEQLLDLDADRWRTLQNDPGFVRQFRDLVDRFDRYVMPDEPTWFERRFPDYDRGPIAYFSTEFGWHESLQTYSGGLGVLSGDHSKSASDLGLPFVGVGLMYRRGYFHQTVDSDGNQQHFYPDYDMQRLPLRPVLRADGRELRVSVELPGRWVLLRAWLAQIGRVPVLLLDSDLPANDRSDRTITSILYISGREMRLCQEIVLGIGGVRVLDALGIRPGLWHMNEGHSALLSLERVARLCDAGDPRSLDDALPEIRSDAVFTTHTPVPAGNEQFAAPLVERYLKAWRGAEHFSIDRILELGRAGDDERTFNMTALALRTSCRANGVSALHGETATEMWRPVLDEIGAADIDHVTNGVHAPTWVGPEIVQLLGPEIDRQETRDPDPKRFRAAVDAVPDERLWEAHQAQKRRLLDVMRDRAREQRARHGSSPDELRRLDDLFDPEVLLIGFARRFATYKRAALLLRDRARLESIVSHAERPVQLLFAGKAHPADRPGQDLIREIWQASVTPELSGRVVFLENYDMQVGRMMTQGVDVWLNTPKRPMEASGTSGMKAALNGGLNCSILDGWWCEGFDATHGWQIGDGQHVDDETQAEVDAESLYHVLADEIATCYYARGEKGYSPEWLRRMKESIADLTPRFSTSRMVREYADRIYLPADSAHLVEV